MAAICFFRRLNNFSNSAVVFSTVLRPWGGISFETSRGEGLLYRNSNLPSVHLRPQPKLGRFAIRGRVRVRVRQQGLATRRQHFDRSACLPPKEPEHTREGELHRWRKEETLNAKSLEHARQESARSTALLLGQGVAA